MTYLDLLTELKKLTENQLQQKVCFSGESISGGINGIWILEEDYTNVGEGLEPLSSYSSEEDFEDMEIVATKDTVFLTVE